MDGLQHVPVLGFLALAACSHADHATTPAQIGIASPGQPAVIGDGATQATKAPMEVPVPSTAVPRATDAGAENHEGGELTVE
jgi:hypothetical protein